MVPSVPENRESPPVNETDRRPVSLRAGKLNLCNYAPPTVRTTSAISFPSPGSPQRPSSSSIANPELSISTAVRSPSVEDAASPASSTISTPSGSPTMVPHVIISGQPATIAQPPSRREEEDVLTCFRPGHIADWDWSGHTTPRVEPTRQRTDLVPVTEFPERRYDIPSPPGGKTLADSNSLYDAFVTQWCFAQGPSLNHHGYDDGGIMA